MSYLCVNFNAICKVSPKCLRALQPENQEYLVEHRWPPVWYLKDFDYYQRCLNEYHREQKDAKQRAAEESCFCFHGREYLNVFCMESFVLCNLRKHDLL